MRRDTAPGWTLPLLILLSLAGAGIGWMLTRYHLSAGQDPSKIFQMACGKDGSGCAEVLSSPWAVLPGGVPLAALGLAYFGGLALWYLVVGLANRRGRFWQGLPFAVQIAGALSSLYLLFVMLGQIRAVCWWCTLSHLLNFALLFVAWKAWPRDDGYSVEGARPSARLGIAGLLLMVALAVLTIQRVLVERARGLTLQANAYARTFYEDTDLQRYLHLRQEPRPIPVRPGDPVRGSLAAPHTVVVFSDFQCPACRGFAEFTERELLPRFGNRLRIVYKHFPLEPDCNSGMQQVIHPQACEAALAAEAARELGGGQAFWRMHDTLFARQGGLPEGPWADLGNQAGLNGAAVAERVARSANLNRVRQDAEAGQALGLHQTPTVILDGRPLDEWRRLDVWQAVLAEPSPSVLIPQPVPSPPSR